MWLLSLKATWIKTWKKLESRRVTKFSQQQRCSHQSEFEYQYLIIKSLLIIIIFIYFLDLIIMFINKKKKEEKQLFLSYIYSDLYVIFFISLSVKQYYLGPRIIQFKKQIFRNFKLKIIYHLNYIYFLIHFSLNILRNEYYFSSYLDYYSFFI